MDFYDIIVDVDDEFISYKSFLKKAEANNFEHYYTEQGYFQTIASIVRHKVVGDTCEKAIKRFKDAQEEIKRAVVQNETETQQTGKRIVRCCGNTPPTPTMVEMLKTGGYAAAKWVLSGFQLVDPVIQGERLDCCEDCEYLTANATRCIKCGCFVRFKAWMATESCPLDKWNG